MKPKWVDVRLVVAIHDEAVYEFGGLGGLRDRALLESAVDKPRNRLAYEPKSTSFELAAALCFGLAKNHAFTDGNKRTALLATHAFLLLNGFELEPGEEDEVLTMIAVADGSLDERGLAAWLKRNSTRLPRVLTRRR